MTVSVDDARRREILKLLQDTLQASPGLLAKELAAKFKGQGIDKTTINGILHRNPNLFEQVGEYRWVLRGPLKVVIPQGWMTARQFESLMTPHAGTKPSRIVFEFHVDAYLMFDAIGLLLTLSNQLAGANIPVSLNFPNSQCSALTYLCRAQFFEHLDPRVVVIPARPLPTQFLGNSENLVELVEIGPTTEHRPVSKSLTNCFVRHSSDTYQGAAGNFFSELIGNIIDHSRSVGFAGMQRYKQSFKRRVRIQTIVSDRGLGIAATLRPVDAIRAQIEARPVKNDIELVREAVEHGGLTSRPNGNGGVGLRAAHLSSGKFGVEFWIRQERFALRYRYNDGKLDEPTVSTQLFPIVGTQICFDFKLPVEGLTS